jgi:hypothetical protein
MKVLFIVTLWFYTVSLSAGTYSDSLTQNTKRYRIGFTATALINKHPGLQLTQTYRLNRWFSADLESIFSFDALFLDRRFVHNYGFRVRPGIRFHFTPEKANHDFSIKFLITTDTYISNLKMTMWKEPEEPIQKISGNRFLLIC